MCARVSYAVNSCNFTAAECSRYGLSCMHAQTCGVSSAESVVHVDVHEGRVMLQDSECG